MFTDQIRIYLTFGHPRLFIFSSLAGLCTFGITLTGREVIIPVSDNSGVVLAASGVSILFLCGMFWALSSLGTLTYSPRLHQPRHIAVSFALYISLATVIVLLAYLVFIYTYARRWPDSGAEIAIGGLFVSFIAFCTSAAHYVIVSRERDLPAKQQLVTDILDAIDAIQTRDRSVVSENVNILDSRLEKLEQHLKKESMPECDDLSSSIDECRSELTGATVSGVQKIVLETVLYGEHEVADMDPHWNENRELFRHIHNDLHDMRDSALRKLDPRYD